MELHTAKTKVLAHFCLLFSSGLDIDECRMSILEGVVACVEVNTECINTEGSFDCACVGGYELVDGECRRM